MPDKVVPSFMTGLTMESLIQRHEKTKDPRVALLQATEHETIKRAQ